MPHSAFRHSGGIIGIEPLYHTERRTFHFSTRISKEVIILQTLEKIFREEHQWGIILAAGEGIRVRDFLS
jgi:hypothetical protein